jgi:hypothetical protein
VQADAGALVLGHKFLQENAVGLQLDGEQVGDIEDARLLAEILANALLFREGISHRIHLDLQKLKNARTVAATRSGAAARRALWGSKSP